MPRPEQCQKCRFYEPGESEEPVSGYCHRHAPKPGIQDTFDELHDWPRILADDWCGEFESANPRTDIIRDSEVSVRIRRAMLHLDVHRFTDLVKTKAACDVLGVPNFGEASLHELQVALAHRGLTLQDRPPL